mmetsp:Transcript_28877/g.51461  ORF Transcript_28877/g.51461 Transcript_28877/m.51461 type:complete len:483 (+) Transcript_28877:1647-3095(+)
MGICPCLGSYGHGAELNENFEYPTSVSLTIKQSGSTRTKTSTFHLTSPIHSEYKNYPLREYTLGITSCILPGQDPYKEVSKVCQDGLFVSEIDGTLLAALFDGHGNKGECVVEFCVNYLKKFFADHCAEFQSFPGRSIEEAIESCDEALNRNPEVDCGLSGTTGVVLYINRDGIHVGSVGDSRAVLGSQTGARQRSERPVDKPDTSNEFHEFQRKIEDVPTIFEIPLTTDQKPNHEGEMERIIEAGGKVARLMDETGKRVGPYRVWNAMGHIPGLAMSRSIGDSVAHSVGVSAVPIVETFPLDPNDRFIIIASDGVWDVMENKDAVNLVERFRKKCRKDNNRPISERVKPTDINIAQLLALEARYRWFDVVQEEDVMIDDISVIIIELVNLPTTTLSPQILANRISITKHSMVNVQENQHIFVSGGLSPRRSDPIRGSHAIMPPPRQSVSRNDKQRGSVVLNEEEKAMLGESVEEIRRGNKH